jgi:hypothetical protein
MRSLTRVSVLMGPPSFGFQSRPAPGPRQDSAVKTPRHQQKGPAKQGPMPTDRGFKLLKPPAPRAEQALHHACDRTA